MIRMWFWRIVNSLHGCGFSMRDGALHPWRGTCPYPLRNDWSIRACIKAGDCGCNECDAAEDALK